jgi:uncharacterized protein
MDGAWGGSPIIGRAARNGTLALQFTKETSTANLIRAWESGRVLIGGRWISGNLIVSADRIVDDWPAARPDALDIVDLAAAIDLAPEIILVGTGETTILPDVDLMAALAARAIGLEIMTTPAACRTYNVLVHERRRVVAALFNKAPPSTR